MSCLTRVFTVFIFSIYCFSGCGTAPLPVAAPETPHSSMPTTDEIAFLGDSITAYMDWASVFPNAVDHGVPGWRTDQISARAKLVAATHPKVALFQGGVNNRMEDGGNGLTHIVSDFRAMIDVFKADSPATRIILEIVLPTDRLDFSSIAQEMRDLAIEEHVEYVDLYWLYFNRPDLYIDGIHLKTPEGYRPWADALKGMIQ